MLSGMNMLWLLCQPAPPKHHHDIFIWVALADFLQKQRHALAVDVGQNQRVKVALRDAHRTISVDILMGEHRFDGGTQGEFGPTVATIADPAKAGFILKHQPQGALLGKRR
jgi:hypothetical protein